MTKEEILQKIYNFLKDNKLDLSNGFNRKFYRKNISPYVKISSHKISDIFGSFTEFKNHLRENYKSVNNGKIKKNKEPYINMGKYLYNQRTKDYIFDFTDVKNIGKVYTFNETQIMAILQDYSNFDKCPKTIVEVSRIHKIPPWVLKKILNALGKVHDSLPLTDEYMENSDKSEEQIAEDLLATRTFNIYQKFNQSTWKQIQENSDKWIQFENGVLSPLKDVLSTLKIDPFIPIKSKLNKQKIENQVYIVCLSDLHFGCSSSKENTFYSKEDWNIDKTVIALRKYIDSIKKDLLNRKFIPNSCVVFSVGDILDSLSGFTDKATKLNTNPIGIKQFRIAVNALVEFFCELKSLFPKISVRSVPGNHDSLGDILLFEFLKIYFKNDNSITFTITTCRWDMFNIGNNLFVLEHGYSAKYKNKVPYDDKSRENYVQKLFIEKSSEFTNPIKNRYFVMGDRHHYEQKTLSSFEFIQLPTIVESDEYSDNLNLKSRPRQQCFILDNSNGIIETLNFYTDI